MLVLFGKITFCFLWPSSGAVAADANANAALCLPADAYPMLNEIEKPQVWRKTRQAHALQK